MGGLLLAVLAAWRIALFAEQWALTELRETGAARVALYAATLRDNLEKFRPIPYILARDPRVRALLQGESSPLRLNPHLEDFAGSAGALFFLLDQRGDTVAASNWRTEQSLIGSNFAFRPYFLDAREGRPGSYYAVGLKTGQPGFFLSYPVLAAGRLLGVVVIKVDLAELELSWRESGETVIVSDAYGVLFLSSRPEWKYHSLRPLPQQTADWLREVQYLGHPLTLLRAERQAGGEDNVLHLDQRSFLEQSRQLLEYGWRIHYLSDLQPVRTAFRLALAVAAVLTASLLLTLLFLRERRQKLHSRREAEEARAIRELNERLQEEIDQHRRTETTLRHTQEELIQAGKLAALGRMSAAIAHELNQPVAAIRTFLASCRLLLARGRMDQVGANLELIDGLAERMGGITGQLKTFARKSRGRREPQDLVTVLSRVLSCLAPQLTAQGVSLYQDLPPAGTAVVAGDGPQLEQVLNNVLQNALDAMAGCHDPALSLHLSATDGEAVLLCRDSGPGIAAEALDALFEPFVTTKEIGRGLGLGLSITYGIVREMDGTIRGQNHPDGGAVFTLRLPLATPLPQARSSHP